MWDERDEAFQDSISSFRKCTDIATKYYEKKTAILCNNTGNKRTHNTNDKLRTIDISDGYDEELLRKFQKVN